WPKWLPMIENAYNSTPHTSTGVTPYFLLLGINPRLPSDALVPTTLGIPRPDGILGGAEDFLKTFDAHRRSARDAIAHAQNNQARHYNKGRKPLV
ncbi:hypothetical protein EXIGLDRAFT_568651, partial [Exidia glandulosa HHB12029]